MSSEHRSLMPFHVRRASEIKETLVIVGIILFYFLYIASTGFKSLVDKAVRPSVYGLTAAYGAGSTMLHRMTGVDLGFVNPPVDKDFIFRVQLATYINERQAQPIMDIAMDQLKTYEQREKALQALLKFPSHEEWIRPFLNDLPKGGMVGLYDESSAALDALFRQIRLEGGIQKPLIRAYAEVSLSFMLQVPDDIIRKKTLGWVSDMLAEDALFLIVPRIEREKVAEVRPKIDAALWDIRAVSNRPRAKELLVPIYKNPPWESVRVPVAVILARLGDNGAVNYLRTVVDSPRLTAGERTTVRVAMASTPYPLRIRPSDEVELAMHRHDRARRLQYQTAMQKQQAIIRAERAQARLERRAEQAQAARVEKPKEEKVAMLPPVAPPPPAKPPVGVQPPVVEPPPAVEPPAKAPVEKPVKKPAVKEAPVVAPPPPVPVEETVEEPVEEEPVVEVPVPKKPESSMRYVDMLFEVKESPALLYANAGDKVPSNVELDVGSKGKATFEVLINEEKWYQVKSKTKSGWVRGDSIKIYDLAPTAEKPAVTAPAPIERAERRETTYFEVVEDGIFARAKPDEKSKQLFALATGTPYLATKSEKIGPDRWFLLTLEDGRAGWVAGIDLQLAEVPAAMKEEQRQAVQPEFKSAFAAEWIVPSVEGVLVYDRPSIAAKVKQKISPPVIYKVIEASAGGGEEWYKIKISEKKNVEGWVQTMDVSLTKP